MKILQRLYLRTSLIVLYGLITVLSLELPNLWISESSLETIDLEVTAIHRVERSSSNIIPMKIHTKFRHGGNDVILKFQKVNRQGSVPFHYYQQGVKLEHVPDRKTECVSIYQDRKSKATALADFCDASGRTHQMVIDLPLNNTQYIILPNVSGGRTKGRYITHKLLQVEEPLARIDELGRGSRNYLNALDQRDIQNARHRRASLTTRHTVELLLVLDYTLYQFWYNLTGNQSIAFSTMQNFYSFLVSAMDMRYKGLLTFGLNVGVELVHILSVVTANDSSWIENNLDPTDDPAGSRGIFDGTAALADFEAWIKAKKSDTEFPKHDHAMLLTGRDLAISGESGAAGYANLAGICTDHSQSIAEDHFNFLSITITTHELGHSLGAIHDGEGNQCNPDDRFIMAARNSPMIGTNARNPWLFSTCSVTSITEKLTELNDNGAKANCLITNDYVNITEASDFMPGQQYNPDQQCQLSQGIDSFLCKSLHTGKYSSLCTGIWCSIEGLNNCTLIIPADGTTCGNKMWCVNGECVASNEAPAADETCLFGDQMGQLSTGYNCNTVVNSQPDACYRESFRSPCCTSCANVRLNSTGCEYGDRQNCSLINAARCYEEEIRTSSCCKTCNDFTYPDLPQNCQYGDKADNCVATQQACSRYPVDCCATCKDVVLSTTSTDLRTTESESSPMESETTPSPTENMTSENKPIEDWVIPVAAVVGGLVFISIISAIICCCRQSKADHRHRKHRHKNRQRHRQSHRSNHQENPSRGQRYGHSVNGLYGPNGPTEYDNPGMRYLGGKFARY